MKCANCGKEISEGDVFCPYCGEQLKESGIGEHNSYGAGPDSLTYVGSYDDREELTDPEDRTFVDSSGIEGQNRGREEDRTVLDSSGVREYGRDTGTAERTSLESGRYSDAGKGSETERALSGSGRSYLPYRQESEPRPASDTCDQYENSNPQDYPPAGSLPASRLNPRSSGQMPYRNGYEYGSAVSGFPRGQSAGEDRPSSLKILIIIIAAVLLLAAAGTAFFLLESRSVSLENLSYGELIEDYDLETEEFNDVQTAYYNNVRFEFEDVMKGKSGYKATALVYTPDLEEVYSKTTDREEVIEQLKRLSEDELEQKRQTVQLNDKKDGITTDSARTLKETADNKYLPAEEYDAGSGSNAASVSSDSGSDSSVSRNNSAADSSSTADPPQSSKTPDAGGTLILTDASATSTLYEKGYDHSPSNVLDGKLSTAWSEGASGQGIGESITVFFNDTFTISSMTIHAGYQKSSRLYGRNSRPKTITLFFSDGSSESAELSDTNSAQTVSINPVATNSVRVQIDSVYAGTVYQDTCISEIRFN